ncbi:hypothetical protein ES703_66489 [subsurface metagenome]
MKKRFSGPQIVAKLRQADVLIGHTTSLFMAREIHMRLQLYIEFVLVMEEITETEIEEQYSYDVYGQPSNVSSLGNPYLFTGRRYDSETGLYYYRARYYKPSIGRFLQSNYT